MVRGEDETLHLKRAWRTYGVEALEKVLWGELTPAVLHIHAPVELPVFTIWKKGRSEKGLFGGAAATPHRLVFTFRQQ